MYYLEVLVGGATYHGNGPLTYTAATEYPRGSIVMVPLRNKQTLGIVTATVAKPSFAVKPLAESTPIPPLPGQLLDLLSWMQEYYPSPLGVIAQQFLPKQLPKKAANPLTVTATDYPTLPTLTPDQQHAVDTIGNSDSFLLHGETGTGKTRVYIELAKRSIEQGKSAMILTPEIGLTSQLGNDLRHVFKDRVVVIHSQLTDVTRQRLWSSLLQTNEPLIIVGARSALFYPIRTIGLIVIDESHETAYKQDQAPYYHASRVAAKLAQLHKAAVVMGSATPLVTDYYMATAKQRPVIRMEQTATPGEHMEKYISVVDLRDRTKFTKKPYLSDELIHSISDTIGRKEQALLFLNRRGTARVIFCERCGWQATCPHCDLPLVYHGDSHLMRCHSCDFKGASPVGYLTCHNASIVFKSIGTKAIVDDITHLFPDARIMRFDTDNKKHERIEQHYEAIKNGDVDILIGTQTLAKGLDLPRLGLVGVVIADTSLYVPDFSAQERTYQLLSQVVGRVGRGHRAGKVVLQTYAPDSALLKAILAKDWKTFYDKELQERSTFLFPPFCYLLVLTCRRASQAAAQKTAQTFARTLVTSPLRIMVEGPAPAIHEKIQNKYQWQLVIKSKHRGELLKVITMLPSGWSYDIDPMNLL